MDLYIFEEKGLPGTLVIFCSQQRVVLDCTSQYNFVLPGIIHYSYNIITSKAKTSTTTMIKHIIQSKIVLRPQPPPIPRFVHLYRPTAPAPATPTLTPTAQSTTTTTTTHTTTTNKNGSTTKI